MTDDDFDLRIKLRREELRILNDETDALIAKLLSIGRKIDEDIKESFEVKNA
jgi:hypothetical protein